MATFDDISAAILVGQGYYTQLLNFNTTALMRGFPTRFNQRIVCLKRLMRALQWDVDDNVNDATTTAIYELLLQENASYDGAGVVVDPNVIIPGHIIVVDGGGSDFLESAPIFFNGTVISIPNWNTVFYPTYGNFPDIRIFTIDGTRDTATVPTYNYTSGDPNQPLLSIEWTYPIATSGYYIISGKKPQST